MTLRPLAGSHTCRRPVDGIEADGAQRGRADQDRGGDRGQPLCPRERQRGGERGRHRCDGGGLRLRERQAQGRGGERDVVRPLAQQPGERVEAERLRAPSHSCTASLRLAKRFSPMPSTSRSSASERKPPFSVRYSRMRSRQRGADPVELVELLEGGRGQAELRHARAARLAAAGARRRHAAGHRAAERHDHLLAVLELRRQVHARHVGAWSEAAGAGHGLGRARVRAHAHETRPRHRARHVHVDRGPRPALGATRALHPQRHARGGPTAAAHVRAARNPPQRERRQEAGQHPHDHGSWRALGHDDDRRPDRVTRGPRALQLRTNRAPPRLAHLEARQPLGLLLRHVHPLHRRAARPARAELHQRVDRVRLALEDRLDGSVAAVAHPARPRRASRPRGARCRGRTHPARARAPPRGGAPPGS